MSGALRLQRNSSRSFTLPNSHGDANQQSHMTQSNQRIAIPRIVRTKPLQVGKFSGILLALTLGVAGFFRIIDARHLVDGPTLGDGQFLALILIPLVSLGLVGLVFIETLLSGYRVLRSDKAISEQLSGRVGYIVLRGAEALLALIGVTLMVAAVPVLLAESTPAPAGVGVMILLFIVGIGILVVSLVRSGAEIFVYSG